MLSLLNANDSRGSDDKSNIETTPILDVVMAKNKADIISHVKNVKDSEDITMLQDADGHNQNIEPKN